MDIPVLSKKVTTNTRLYRTPVRQSHAFAKYERNPRAWIRMATMPGKSDPKTFSQMVVKDGDLRWLNKSTPIVFQRCVVSQP